MQGASSVKIPLTSVRTAHNANLSDHLTGFATSAEKMITGYPPVLNGKKETWDSSLPDGVEKEVDIPWILHLLEGEEKEKKPAIPDVEQTPSTSQVEEKDEERITTMMTTPATWSATLPRQKKKKRGRPVTRIPFPVELIKRTPSSRIKYALLLCHQMGYTMEVPNLFVQSLSLQDFFA